MEWLPVHIWQLWTCSNFPFLSPRHTSQWIYLQKQFQETSAPGLKI